MIRSRRHAANRRVWEGERPNQFRGVDFALAVDLLLALNVLIKEAQIIIEPVTEAQARVAREAYRDFGKASGHPAKLNFGDCFTYALAKVLGEPLLFKGDDFAHTDIKPASN